MKTAFVFPGQGAQYVGMATDFISENHSLLNILQDFDNSHDTELAKVMSQGPEELLKQTHLTQPAILFHSVCAWHEFQKEFDICADFVAGHSLGEFTALVASGILSIKDAMHIVHKRGEFMIKAVGDIPFAMAAIIGLDPATVNEICMEANATGLVQAVNYNTPIQTVISGAASGVNKASELAKAKGAKRVLPLVVGGPFHTPLIAKASEWLTAEMAKFTFKNGKIPVVSNLDAVASTDGDTARQKLGNQIVSPVRWVDSVRYMVNAGVTRFIEFGPQKVLSGMIKNIDKEVTVYSVDRKVDIVELKQVIK
ncbi:MAG: ACP S-malonyltransferase [Candidatus Cloacimonetes bacterium]|nr:ACP S-malonyltransferase [Candidatus Cloacimonadota bacterium]